MFDLYISPINQDEIVKFYVTLKNSSYLILKAPIQTLDSV